MRRKPFQPWVFFGHAGLFWPRIETLRAPQVPDVSLYFAEYHRPPMADSPQTQYGILVYPSQQYYEASGFVIQTNLNH